MPLPLSDPQPVPERVEYNLQTPEELAARRRLRRRLLILAVAAVLGIGGWFSARPVLHAIKIWQARRLSAQALAAVSEENWSEARDKVQDAFALWPSEPEVVRAAAVFLTRVGQGREAMSYWKVFESSGPLTADDQRDFAAAALAAGELPLAREHLALAWPAGQPGTAADWWLGLQIALRVRQIDEAIRLSRLLTETPGVPERRRLGAAQVLLSLNQPELVALGSKTVQEIARGGHSPESLDALLLLARQSAALLARKGAAGAAEPTAPAAGPAPIPLSELIPLIEAHPLAKAPQKLLAYDLRLLDKPAAEDRATLIQQALDRFGGSSDPEELSALAAWLYAKGEFEKLAKILPLDKALRSRALFLQYLDTLGATGRWVEIKDLIQAQRFPLEPMYQQMYLARCTAQLGDREASQLHWNAAIDGAKGSAEKLLLIGQYAERNAALDAAEMAFRSAYSVAPTSRPVCEALLHLLEARGETAKMLDLLRKAVVTWPKDDAMRNDIVYLDLLLGHADAANLESARALVRADPASLPHRVTLALAEHRSGHALSALDAFSGVGGLGAGTPPRFLAVYAAVLWATDYSKEARRTAGSIPQDQLLPEERELIRPVLER